MVERETSSREEAVCMSDERLGDKGTTLFEEGGLRL